MEGLFTRHLRPILQFTQSMVSGIGAGYRTKKKKQLIRDLRKEFASGDIAKMPISSEMEAPLRSWVKAHKKWKKGNVKATQKAAEELEHALLAHSGFCGPALYATAISYELLGDTAGAVKRASALLEMSPSAAINRHVKKYLTRLTPAPKGVQPVSHYARQGAKDTKSGNYADAIHNLQIALAIRPDSYLARMALVKALDERAASASQEKRQRLEKILTEKNGRKTTLEQEVREEAGYVYALGARSAEDEDLLLKAMDIDKPDFERTVVINIDQINVYNEEKALDDVLAGLYGKKDKDYTSAQEKKGCGIIENKRHRLNVDPENSMKRAVKRLNARDTQVVFVTSQKGTGLAYAQIWAHTHFGKGVSVESVEVKNRGRFFRDLKPAAYLGGKGGEGSRADYTLRCALKVGVDSYLLKSMGETHEDAEQASLFRFSRVA